MHLPITFQPNAPKAYTLTAFVSPIQTAREAMRLGRYGDARNGLLAEFRKDTSKMQLAEVVNLIDMGMIPEAIDGLNRMQLVEDYNQNKPADGDIGKTV